MEKWKFKVGDIMYSIGNEEQYTVTGGCLEYGIERYNMINSFGVTLRLRKDVIEEMCKLVTPKSLFEQVLELLGLKVGDEFIFNEGQYKVESHQIKRLSSLNEYLFPSRITIQDLLLYSDNIVKSESKPTTKQKTMIVRIYTPKSEAELILDELQKVVDKANGILERSVR